MTEPKPLASLTSGLLARKGAARPAMRRQQMLGNVLSDSHSHASHDDLGWNDMGYDVDPVQAGDSAERHESGLSPMAGHETHSKAAVHQLSFDAPLPTPAEPEVVQQQRRVQALAAVPAAAPVAAKPARAPKERAAVGAKGSFAFTLRLDASRHLYLRLASATSNRSAQQIMIKLLDEFVAAQPTLAALAATATTTGETA
jgi:hypothetical protein